jgi:ribose 1,5-bisphosphokinase PhnN
VNYWITKAHVDSLFDKNPDTLHIWHTASTVVAKLREKFQQRVYCVYLRTDPDVLISRLRQRDNLSVEEASKRLAHDP